MAYMIHSIDLPDMRHLRAQHRQAHLDYIKLHQSRILYSGGIYDTDNMISGGIIVLNVTDKADVELFLAQDPFTLNGLKQETKVYKTYTACLAGAFVAGQSNPT